MELGGGYGGGGDCDFGGFDGSGIGNGYGVDRSEGGDGDISNGGGYGGRD
jgi:hypothetical protein